MFSRTLTFLVGFFPIFTYIGSMKSIWICLCVLLVSNACLAESISLSSGEVVEGKLIEFPKEVTLELPDGTKSKIPYQNITSIYKASPPETYSPFLTPGKDSKPLGEKTPADIGFATQEEGKGPYATPMQTFNTWKEAALKDDIDGMVNCYVSYRKEEVKKDLKKLPKRTRKDMQAAMAGTIFTPSDPFFQGELAIMEVSWTKGLASQTQTLKFTLEGDKKEWKILE